MDYSHQRVFAWVAAACTVFIASTSFAANLNVCMDSCVYKTVQSAVDAAVEGDTVRIYPGRYVGNITTAGKELTFTGTNQAASEVLLVGTGVGPVFTLGGGSNGTSPHAIFISYVTVTGGSHFQGTGEGIEDQITQNNVYNASGASLGGGLYVNVSPTQLIQGSVIASNSVYSIAEAGSGGGVYAASSDPTVSWTLDGDFIVLNTAGDANQPAHPSAGGVQNVGKLSLINGSSIAGNVPVQCLGGKGCPAN
jgi:pectin methylesterase-like acyl-CoA thioesterase